MDVRIATIMRTLVMIASKTITGLREDSLASNVRVHAQHVLILESKEKLAA